MSTIETELSTCERQSAAFYAALDRNDYATVVDSFAASGTWMRAGVPVSGHTEIHEMLNARDQSIETRHLATSIFGTSTGNGQIRVALNLIVFLRHEGDSAAQSMTPRKVLSVVDDYEKSTDGWKLVMKQIVADF